MYNTIMLVIVSVAVLGFGPWMILYWIPKWDAVGIKKAKQRIAREGANADQK